MFRPKFDPRSRMYLVKQKSAGAVEYGIPICGRNPTPSNPLLIIRIFRREENFALIYVVAV